jgi:hypothetical protein
MQMITLGNFLTDAQMRKVTSIFNADPVHFHSRVLEEVIRPNMAEINRKLGQDNSPEYLAYAVEYACLHAAGRV